MSNYALDREEIEKKLVVTKYIKSDDFDDLIDEFLVYGVLNFNPRTYGLTEIDGLNSIGCGDYSPVFNIYTCLGEYGFEQLTVFASGMVKGLLFRYDYQYEGQINTEYFVSPR